MDRFWSKVEKSEGCWEWAAFIGSGGYGMFRVGAKVRRAHRVAYELTIGPIPDGLQVDHLCRNRSCVNPHHLEVVTQAENVRRGLKGRLAATKTRCPKGHPYSKDSRGYNFCRTCRRRSWAKWRESNRPAKGAWGRPREKCRANLHDLNDENTYVSPTGLRVCKACRRINKARIRAKRKAAA